MRDGSLRDAYAAHAVDQVPRILSSIDRNPQSPTYGCFHRDYWLDKTSDFADAVRQFGVHALALLYTREFPGNIYKAEPQILEWALAGLRFWASIQHNDGSFDEFYPYERGWCGPTAFTTYTAAASLKLLGAETDADLDVVVRGAIEASARFIAAGESEDDHLANHHAMAYLAVWTAADLLEDSSLFQAAEAVWRGFLEYHDLEEGWSREYDGIDPGYLSATVSFLGKVYRETRNPELQEVLTKSAEVCGYFCYPDGQYAGLLGSRNTMHFYPHGFEILAMESPTAAGIAESMLRAVNSRGVVPPAIMPDRYLAYRVPEFLLSYLDYGFAEKTDPTPAERATVYWHLARAGGWARSKGDGYMVANLAKGGVFKHFQRSEGRLVASDGGLTARLDDGRLVTSQWIDPKYSTTVEVDSFSVHGYMALVPRHRVFTLMKGILFRSALLLLGRWPVCAHWLKGRIRRALILDSGVSNVAFQRHVQWNGETLEVVDQIELTGKSRLVDLYVGGEDYVRYVPQSRYFQRSELHSVSLRIPHDVLRRLHDNRSLKIVRTWRLPDREFATDFE